MIGRIFTAKGLALIIAVAMLTSTVSIYAASISGTTKKLGGTGNVSVTSSTTSADLQNYSVDSSGNITGVTVSWTPASNSIYQVAVLIKNGATVLDNASCVRAASGTVLRSDTLTLTGGVSPSQVDGTTINIVEVASGATTCS